MGPEHGGECPPLDPPVGGRRIFTRELVTLHSVPSVELGGCGCQVPPQIMAPVAEAHIGGSQSEVDLEVQ